MINDSAVLRLPVFHRVTSCVCRVMGVSEGNKVLPMNRNDEEILYYGAERQRDRDRNCVIGSKDQ